MLRRLVKNTAISAIAYGIAGVLGLIAVGIIVRTWGYAALGLLVIVRNLLPTGFLALVDFGVSETATQAVARARGSGKWDGASETVTLLFAGALAIGLASGVLLWLGAPALAALFKVAASESNGFVLMVRATAVVLPLAFVSLVVEGVLKGFESYVSLRVVEILGTLAYVAAVFAQAVLGGNYQGVAFAFLAVIVVRTLVLAAVARQIATAWPLRLARWEGDSRKDVLMRSRLMFMNRVTGSLQSMFPPIVVGVVLGPAAVGSYDVLTRLPRFLKSTLGLISASVLPTSALLAVTEDTNRLALLGRHSIVLPASMFLPPLLAIALFSKDILTHWVGTELARQWPWMAVMLIVPATSLILAPSHTALLVRPHFVKQTNRLLLYQSLIQYIVAALFVSWLSEHSMILGQAFAALIFLPLLARRTLREWRLPVSLFASQLWKHGLVALALTLLVVTAKAQIPDPSLAQLALLVAFASLAAWIASYIIVLTADDRAMIARILGAARPV